MDNSDLYKPPTPAPRIQLERHDLNSTSSADEVSSSLKSPVDAASMSSITSTRSYKDKNAQRQLAEDSFSGLTVLMRQKKPYKWQDGTLRAQERDADTPQSSLLLKSGSRSSDPHIGKSENVAPAAMAAQDLGVKFRCISLSDFLAEYEAERPKQDESSVVNLSEIIDEDVSETTPAVSTTERACNQDCDATLMDRLDTALAGMAEIFAGDEEELTVSVEESEHDSSVDVRASSTQPMQVSQGQLPIVLSSPVAFDQGSSPSSGSTVTIARTCSVPPGFSSSDQGRVSPLMSYMMARNQQALGHRDEKSLVRLTQHAWDDIVQYTGERDLIIADLSRRVRRLEGMGSWRIFEADTVDNIDKLRYQVEAHKNYQVDMRQQMHETSLQNHRMKLENQNLSSRLTEFEQMKVQLERSEVELKYAHKSKIALEADHARIVASIVTKKDEKIDQLQALVAHKRESIHSKQSIDAAVRQQSTITKLQEKLEEEQRRSNQLTNQVEHLQSTLVPVKVHQDLEAKYHEAIGQIHSQTHEVKQLASKLDRSMETNKKLHNGAALRGSAHPVYPYAVTLLPKTVMPCLECFGKNIDCDNKARCENCKLSGEKCARWRCSVHHVLGKCEEGTCRLTHDGSGWLMSRDLRPQW